MIKLRFLCVALSLVCITCSVMAEESPDKIVEAIDNATQKPAIEKQTPEQRWQNFLQEQGWGNNADAGGIVIVDDRDLIISSASVFTKVGLGQPGWVESRVMAFEQAEMEAKGKIIRYLSDTVDAQRSLELLENAVWEDGEVEKVKNLNDAVETLKRIGKKSMKLTEAKLDSVIQKIDPDYDPSEYANKSDTELQIIAEQKLKQQIQSIAMRTLIGVSALYSTETLVGNNEYQVLVGMIWSPKLNRLAMSLFNDEYTIPEVKPSKTLHDHIPVEELTLLGTMGTRIVIDENGHYAVIAYGQAQPRRAAPSRQQAALHQAKEIAANRAKGAIVNFIQEGMTLRQTNLTEELSREFSDMTVGTEIVREYRNSIKGKKVKVDLKGLRILKEWNSTHPATGQSVAGTVVAWSPSSVEVSKKADITMKQSMQEESKKLDSESTKVSETATHTDIGSMKVDTSAY